MMYIWQNVGYQVYARPETHLFCREKGKEKESFIDKKHHNYTTEEVINSLLLMLKYLK